MTQFFIHRCFLYKARLSSVCCCYEWFSYMRAPHIIQFTTNYTILVLDRSRECTRPVSRVFVKCKTADSHIVASVFVLFLIWCHVWELFSLVCRRLSINVDMKWFVALFSVIGVWMQESVLRWWIVWRWHFYRKFEYRELQPERY